MPGRSQKSPRSPHSSKPSPFESATRCIARLERAKQLLSSKTGRECLDFRGGQAAP